jgi:exonuclease III
MNKRKSGCWEWLLDQHSPDYVMAQEASPLPEGLDATVRTTTKKSNRTVFYSKNQSHEKIKMEYDEGMGILVTRYSETYFINVYANLDFKPVNPSLLGFIAKFVSHIRRRYGAENIVIAGDFNMDRRMDDNPTGSRFASKDTYPTNDFFDAILDMGFADCVRKFYPEPVQTHRHVRSKFPWELDHMFATPILFDRLESLDIPDASELSDHNPIIADFK